MKTYKKVTKAIAALIASLFLGGCTFTSGAPELRDIGRYMTLQAGQSTKADVYGRWRQPHDVLTTDKGSTWVYVYGTTKMHGATFAPFVGIIFGGSQVDATVISITFDNNERFASLKTEEESSYVNQWVGIAMAMVPSDKDREARVRQEMTRLNLPYSGNATVEKATPVTPVKEDPAEISTFKSSFNDGANPRKVREGR